MTQSSLPAGFQRIDKNEAQARFDLNSVDTIGRIFHDHIFVHSGDLELESLDETWFQETFFGADESRHQALLIIDGNLKVGALSLGANHTFPSLIVRGDVHANMMEVNSSLMQIDGDLTIERAYHGYQDQGQLRVGGVARVPLFISYNHPVWFDLAPDAEMISINYYSEEEEYFDYDYSLPEVLDIFDSELFSSGRNLRNSTVAFNFAQKMVSRLEKGESPFRAGFVPKKKG